MPTMTNVERTNTQLNLFNQKFGVEIEFTGITYGRASTILKEKLQGQTTDDYDVIDQQDRTWVIKYDSSIRPENGGDRIEFATPPLYYNDIEKLQEIVRGFRAAGGKVNDSCGIHIHVEGANHNLETTKNFIRLFAKYEDVIYKALKVDSQREERFCRKLHDNHSRLLNRLNSFTTASNLLNYFDDECSYYPKYTGLNLLKLLYNDYNQGTFEFRVFNSTLHAGKVRAYIILSLMMSAYAVNVDNQDSVTVTPTYENLVTFLNTIGINQEQDIMKNVFKHLTKYIQPEQTQQVS